MGASAIRVRDLRKEYPGRKGPVHAVNGIDLEIGQGECFGLLGPNGAGKTTTVEILEGLNEPTSGEVEILGLRWATDETAIRERIGVTLQETRLPDKETVREIVTLFRSFYRRGLAPDDVIERVALETKADAYIEQLSGGQQQRLAVALSLVGDPEILFLDEPTTGLDPQSRRQLWDLIRELGARDRTVVLTTHYMDEAERLCDRVAIIDMGKIIALGSPSELIARLGGDHIIEFALEAGGEPLGADAFLGLDSVLDARSEADGYVLTVAEPHRAIPAVLDMLDRLGRPLARLTTRHVSLEDVFVSLTGRHLRDDEPADAAPEGAEESRQEGLVDRSRARPACPIGIPRGRAAFILNSFRSADCGFRTEERGRLIVRSAVRNPPFRNPESAIGNLGSGRMPSAIGRLNEFTTDQPCCKTPRSSSSIWSGCATSTASRRGSSGSMASRRCWRSCWAWRSRTGCRRRSRST